MYGFQFAELYSIDLCKQGNLCDPSTQFGYPSLILMDRLVLGDRKMLHIDSLNMFVVDKAYLPSTIWVNFRERLSVLINPLSVKKDIS